MVLTFSSSTYVVCISILIIVLATCKWLLAFCCLINLNLNLKKFCLMTALTSADNVCVDADYTESFSLGQEAVQSMVGVIKSNMTITLNYIKFESHSHNFVSVKIEPTTY